LSVLARGSESNKGIEHLLFMKHARGSKKLIYDFVGEILLK
jgi:hypothetical protein